MNALIENYINGNLSTARRQAKRHSFNRIWKALHLDFGFSTKKATLVAYWLKTGFAWQESCDAE